MDVFHDDLDRLTYLRLVKKQAADHGVEILAWCLMTNHVHFIAIPEEASSLARAFGEAHRLYTRMKNFREGARGYLFQGRFASCVLSEQHLIAAARYVEQNPVRARIVNNPWDYEWSSASFHVGIAVSDFLVEDRTLMGLVSDWTAFLSDRDTETDEKVCSAVTVGRPMGDDLFVRAVEAITGRDLSRGKSGRPAKPK